MRVRNDTGETLVEILITVVIIGLTITALVSSLGVAGNAGNAHRSSVQTDVEMRNYAEATKAAARDCVDGGSYNVVYYTKPGFTFTTTLTGTSPAVTDDNLCPAVATTKPLTLTVDGPMGVSQTVEIRVRTP